MAVAANVALLVVVTATAGKATRAVGSTHALEGLRRAGSREPVDPGPCVARGKTMAPGAPGAPLAEPDLLCCSALAAK